MIRAALITIVAAVAVIPDASSVCERVLRSEMILAAPLEQVWALWTTEAGLTSFFARGARIEPKLDGFSRFCSSPRRLPGYAGTKDCGFSRSSLPSGWRLPGTLRRTSHIPELNGPWLRSTWLTLAAVARG